MSSEPNVAFIKKRGINPVFLERSALSADSEQILGSAFQHEPQ
jgi:hypothetical protein